MFHSADAIRTHSRSDHGLDTKTTAYSSTNPASEAWSGDERVGDAPSPMSDQPIRGQSPFDGATAIGVTHDKLRESSRSVLRRTRKMRKAQTGDMQNVAAHAARSASPSSHSASSKAVRPASVSDEGKLPVLDDVCQWMVEATAPIPVAPAARPHGGAAHPNSASSRLQKVPKLWGDREAPRGSRCYAPPPCPPHCALPSPVASPSLQL